MFAITPPSPVSMLVATSTILPGSNIEMSCSLLIKILYLEARSTSQINSSLSWALYSGSCCEKSLMDWPTKPPKLTPSPTIISTTSITAMPLGIL